jgi:hypothetical protein
MATGKFLVCKGKAGLGNRLLSVLGSILYAEMTSRQLYIDWSDQGYSKDRGNSFPHFFQWPELVDPAPIWTSKSIAPEIWKGHLAESVDELMARHETNENADMQAGVNSRYTADFLRVDQPEDVLVRWSYTDEMYFLRRHFKGNYSQLRMLEDEQILKNLVRDRLKLVPAIRRRIDEFRDANFSDVNIGLHIRYTDRKNSFDQYPVLVDKIMRKHPNATVFLATDNKTVEKTFRDRYARVAVTEKWSAEPGTPLHRTRACPDKFELGVEALVDMYLLGHCEYLVYNKTSTFGVFASLLSQAPKENVFETSPLKEEAKNLVRWLKRKLV